MAVMAVELQKQLLVLTLEEEHVLEVWEQKQRLLLGKGQEEERAPKSRFEPSEVELELVDSDGVESGIAELECCQRPLVEGH